MNQLSNNVIDLARYRRARDAARGRAASDGRRQRQRGSLLTCRWRRDAASGTLICAWAAQRGAREAQPPSRRSPAN